MEGSACFELSKWVFPAIVRCERNGVWHDAAKENLALRLSRAFSMHASCGALPRMCLVRVCLCTGKKRPLAFDHDDLYLEPLVRRCSRYRFTSPQLTGQRRAIGAESPPAVAGFKQRAHPEQSSRRASNSHWVPFCGSGGLAYSMREIYERLVCGLLFSVDRACATPPWAAWRLWVWPWILPCWGENSGHRIET